MKDEQNNRRMTDLEEVIRLVGQLYERDGMKRRQARVALEQMGRAATPYLIDALDDDNASVRWEAAKALVTIADPDAARALVHGLLDESFEVQWLAAEGLIALKREALVPLLRVLMRINSDKLRQGAHHVLHALEREGLLREKELKLLNGLRDIDSDVESYLMAKDALEAIEAETETNTAPQ